MILMCSRHDIILRACSLLLHFIDNANDNEEMNPMEALNIAMALKFLALKQFLLTRHALLQMFIVKY
jgi:hypothetical protein